MSEDGNNSQVAAEAADATELLVEALSAGGDGVAHLDGKAVFLPGTAPGDRVLAKLFLDQGERAAHIRT